MRIERSAPLCKSPDHWRREDAIWTCGPIDTPLPCPRVEEAHRHALQRSGRKLQRDLADTAQPAQDFAVYGVALKFVPGGGFLQDLPQPAMADLPLANQEIKIGVSSLQLRLRLVHRGTSCSLLRI